MEGGEDVACSRRPDSQSVGNFAGLGFTAGEVVEVFHYLTLPLSKPLCVVSEVDLDVLPPHCPGFRDGWGDDDRSGLLCAASDTIVGCVCARGLLRLSLRL